MKCPQGGPLHPKGTYFGKLLEGILQGARMEGSKPLFSARLRKMLSLSPQDI
jgi:hypothetical protein